MPGQGWTVPRERVEVAIDFALGELGTTYELGAESPDTYDCSALVRSAFAAADLDLPRVSRDQFEHTAPVSLDNLRRGDLLFFDQPVGHVGIYLGEDRILHASRSQEEVEVRDVFWDSFTGAGPI